MNFFRNIWRHFFPPKRKRIDFRFVTYDEGNGLIDQGWTLAPEEDTNQVLGMVYLELLEKEPCPK